MSDFKNVMKGGWHPKGKDGGKESWRGDFKGINQVAGWMGKGKDPNESARQEHIARPLATLKDPSLFGPPPKNVNYHGGAALPNEITPHRGGLGAPMTKEEISSARQAAVAPTAEEEEEQMKPAPPPLPYRADRTGLRTDNLPAPPVHKELRDASPAPTSQGSRPTPNLPPRLPSRQNTVEAPPPPYEPAASSNPVTSPTPSLNQSAINRLGKAGVSVPGFGIGTSNEPAATASTDTKSWRGARSQFTAPASGLSELQSRFAKMNTSNTSADQTATSPAPGTTTSPQSQTPPAAPTWQQTRSALTTANSAYKDPSTVSLADAQQAAATAQNAQRSAVAFRERHGETINAAQTRATQLNKRYNMTGRLNRFLEDANNAHDQQEQHQQQQTPEQQQQTGIIPGPPPPTVAATATPTPTLTTTPAAAAITPVNSSTTPQKSELTASISRKPPPPPPPKKPASMQAPPPVPLGTRPNFS